MKLYWDLLESKENVYQSNLFKSYELFILFLMYLPTKNQALGIDALTFAL